MLGARIPSFLPTPGKVPKVAPNKANNQQKQNRSAAAHRVAGGGRPKGPAPKHQPSAPAHAGPPSPLEMNPAQLHAYNTKQVGENTQAELLPLRQRSAEINNQEATAAKRYAGMAETNQGLLGTIQGQQQASAKTASNEAAESALRASKAIETAGQQSTQQNASYMDPQLKAALGNQQANITATSQANQAGTAQANQNEANFLTNLRAVATQRATEGQQGIASAYGKQRGEVGGQERQALARQGGQISKLDTEGLQKQFVNRATEAGLGIKTSTLQQKGQETAAKVNATVRGQNVTAANNLRTTQTSRENSERTAATSRQNKQADLTYKETHPTGTKSSAPKVPNPASATKYISEVGSAEAKANLWLGSKKNDPAQQKKTREALARAGATADQISAALNLAVYGRLGPSDQEAASAYGEVKRLRPAWFKHK